jgi:hypothetical protein
MYIYILKCGPGLLFLGLNWLSVQVEFDMPAVDPFLGDVVPRTEADNSRRASVEVKKGGAIFHLPLGLDCLVLN